MTDDEDPLIAPLTKEELTCARCKQEYPDEKAYLMHFATVHKMTVRDILNLPAFREALEDDN